MGEGQCLPLVPATSSVVLVTKQRLEAQLGFWVQDVGIEASCT